jgi:hypothetical protein
MLHLRMHDKYIPIYRSCGHNPAGQSVSRKQLQSILSVFEHIQYFIGYVVVRISHKNEKRNPHFVEALNVGAEAAFGSHSCWIYIGST